MAKIELAPPLSDIRGSIGGITFQRNRSGLIVRLKPKGIHVSTAKQTANQQLFMQFQREWQDLTLSQKNLWNDYADTYIKDSIWGTEKRLSGQNYFQTINRNKQLFGSASVQEPPAHILPIAVPYYRLLCSDSIIKIKFQTHLNTINDYLVILTSAPVSESLGNNRSNYRITALDDSEAYDEIDITSDWETTHGLSFPPGTSADKFTLHSLIYFVNIVSGLNGPGLLSSYGYDQSLHGIGYMTIGFDFTVS